MWRTKFTVLLSYLSKSDKHTRLEATRAIFGVHSKLIEMLGCGCPGTGTKALARGNYDSLTFILRDAIHLPGFHLGGMSQGRSAGHDE